MNRRQTRPLWRRYLNSLIDTRRRHANSAQSAHAGPQECLDDHRSLPLWRRVLVGLLGVRLEREHRRS